MKHHSLFDFRDPASTRRAGWSPGSGSLSFVKGKTGRLLALLTVALIFNGPSLAAPGDLDPSFGNDGNVVTSFGGDGGLGISVAVQDDGKIVVAGSAGSGNDSDFALARYNSDGTLDNGFGNSGRVITAFTSFHDTAYQVALQSDGKIVVVGTRPARRFSIRRRKSGPELQRSRRLTTASSFERKAWD